MDTLELSEGAEGQTTYSSLRSRLGDQLNRVMQDLTPQERRALRAGELSEAQLQSSLDRSRNSWERSCRPAPSEELERRLGADFGCAVTQMSAAEKEDLRAGKMTPARMRELAALYHDLNPEVLVVGAGMAGVEAAEELTHAGLHTTVLEATGRVGGRVRTDHDIFGTPCDLGAFWLHQDSESPNPLIPLATKLGLQVLDDGHQVLACDGQGHDLVKEGRRYTGERDALHQAYIAAGETGADPPLSQVPVPPTKWGRVAADSLGTLDMARDRTTVSSQDYATMADETDDKQLKGGLGQLVEALSGGLNIHTDAPVETIKWGPEGVEVSTRGQTYRAKKLLLTVSTGVLNSGRIKFDPPLPAWKLEAISKLPMSNLKKVVLQFDHNVTPGAEVSAFLHLQHPENQPVEFLLRPQGTNFAVGFLGGPFATQTEHQTDQATVDFALKQLERAYGPQVKRSLVQSAVTHWESEPYTLGAYSVALPGYQPMRKLLAAPVGDTLFFAGEATQEAYAATVAGAYLSGHQAAVGIEHSLA